ncbi:hypothetical protein [Gordonia sp. CPCC 205333]|uniref:hypothetical protein n=1 Tax=Gordonia sp. CPCC 205333 TaxID=3140790 RepID=UPI003AF3F429
MIDAVEDLARRWPTAAPIYRKLIRPLDVAVIGMPSSGRATIVRALHRSLSVTAVAAGPSTLGADADISLYLLVGRVRAGEAEAIARLPCDRRLVLLNKADACGPPDVVIGVAERCGSALGTEVLPVSGLWGAVTVTSDDAALLRDIAAGEALPARFAAQFAAVDPRRANLLGRIGRQGVVDCVEEVRAGRIAGNPRDFDQLLRRRSGLRQVSAAFAAMAGPIAIFRQERARTELSTLAAAAPGQLRDAVEHVLIGGRR